MDRKYKPNQFSVLGLILGSVGLGMGLTVCELILPSFRNLPPTLVAEMGTAIANYPHDPTGVRRIAPNEDVARAMANATASFAAGYSVTSTDSWPIGSDWDLVIVTGDGRVFRCSVHVRSWGRFWVFAFAPLEDLDRR